MNSSKIKIMSEENVAKALFKLGMPMVVSMLIMALYNVVDTYFVSGLGKHSVAAVSVAFPISLIFSGIGLTFGAGAGSYISRLLGGEKKKEADIVATVAMFTSVIIGAITGMTLLFLLTDVLKFMGAIPSIIEIAKKYAIIFIISTMVSTANVTAGNLAVAQGAAKVSLKAMIIGSVLNMVLDPIFIYGLNLGVNGAAIATLISQVVTLFIYIIYFKSEKSYIKLKISNFKPTINAYKEILKVGISMFLLQIFSSISMSKISSSASLYGEDAIAAMGIVLRIVTLGTNVVFGYMKGLQPLAGFNYGAKNYKRLNEAIRCCIKYINLFCLVWTILLYIFAPNILSIFGTGESVLKIAVPALRAGVIMFITFGFQFTYSTLYLSMGKALAGGFLSICRQGIIFLPIILLLPKIFGLNGVIYSQAVADLITTIITIPFAIDVRKKLRLNSNEI
ncbi:Multidrug export protein MepA [Streptococcus intermedius]|jgi:MATE efflux family protein|uniref:MATE family efflux transporter n=1 Tax=Bacilli TaxID=91061 RepID=UPI0007680ADB|nr:MULTISPECIES: MATE family efflux transporter [Bacilli]HEO5548997.1 MATE family efflux transporter [Streptococcus agalactiae]AME09550.1 MATE family efflux transporter [Gemella sp. oral taxon 928]RSJ10577.1 Multidrug export protein MepA [Streptococcus intermedius]RSJ16509.1 Multidrug export protein MepA [Streptococcus intermedius]RSJ31920.1 Multidrug export protein MepA [Streptococcus intermedius]